MRLVDIMAGDEKYWKVPRANLDPRGLFKLIDLVLDKTDVIKGLSKKVIGYVSIGSIVSHDPLTCAIETSFEDESDYERLSLALDLVDLLELNDIPYELEGNPDDTDRLRDYAAPKMDLLERLNKIQPLPEED